MIRQRNAKYFALFIAVFMISMCFHTGEAKAASKLALFSFEYAENLEIEKGVTLNLASGDKTAAWVSSNPKVIKVSSNGIATALKPGKAVISAKINGKKAKCSVRVVKNILKESKYIGDICNTWKNMDTDEHITIEENKIMEGINQLLALEPSDMIELVAYKKCNKITAVTHGESGTTIYFNATGKIHGKTSKKYPCLASVTKGEMVLFHTPYVAGDRLLYGTGTYWYDEDFAY